MSKSCETGQGEGGEAGAMHYPCFCIEQMVMAMQLVCCDFLHFCFKGASAIVGFVVSTKQHTKGLIFLRERVAGIPPFPDKAADHNRLRVQQNITGGH